jgi:NADH dehydrogenase
MFTERDAVATDMAGHVPTKSLAFSNRFLKTPKICANLRWETTMTELLTGRKGAKEILILGGGFGGVYAAMELEKLLEGELKSGEIHVTLVSHDNYFLFTPMLHEVAASDLDASHIVNPLHKLLKSGDFFCGDIDDIDLPNRSVRVSHQAPGGKERHSHDLPYDHLIVALGSVASFQDVPGVEERALTMRTLGDAVALRGRMIETLEVADSECFAAMRAPLLTFVIAGGGFSGVETAGAVNDFLRDAIKSYPNLSEKNLRVVVVHSGEHVLPELGEKLGKYATGKLREHGIEVLLGARVASADDGLVTLKDGSVIPAQTLIWTVGNAINALLGELPCATTKGRVCVNDNLEVSEWPDVWVLGDAAYAIDPNTDKPYPATAQHALRQGKVVARNVVASLRAKKKKPFRFKTLGQLATIGRRAGVASVFGFQFSGFAAWFMWRTIYLSKLPRFEKKLRVAVDWTMDLFFSKDLVQLSTPTARFHAHRSFPRPPLVSTPTARFHAHRSHDGNDR